jgi:hypothetical protein
VRCLPVERPPNGFSLDDEWLENLATSITD